MTKNELKAKYGRIAADPSQLEMFKNDVIDGNVTGLPELPEEAEGKTLVLQMQDGELSWTEGGGGPSEPVEKGSIVKLADGNYYRVLSVNEDLSDCELMHIGPVTISAYNTNAITVDFTVDGARMLGLKYEDSLLDRTCEAFYEALPDDVKAAIIEQEVEQDMYDLTPNEGTEDFSILNPMILGGQVYRFKKRNDTQIAVGIRHAYALSCGAIKDYFGGTSTKDIDVAKVFQFESWFRDAQWDVQINACNLIYDYSSGIGVRKASYYSSLCVCPAFHINLKQLGF